ncbi:hypothetical protein [Tabrizicola sp.]|uniref:hypothetical protein n=1 Tax=Tabrizicola sp. TaxID=2005166 RepID=UPI00286AAEFF|nr:hypothetical protein [Tabrizicola sp.]
MKRIDGIRSGDLLIGAEAEARVTGMVGGRVLVEGRLRDLGRSCVFRDDDLI